MALLPAAARGAGDEDGRKVHPHQPHVLHVPQVITDFSCLQIAASSIAFEAVVVSRVA